MEQILNQFLQTVGTYAPSVLAAVAILVVGWLIALILAAIIGGLIRRTSLDERLAPMLADEEQPEEERMNIAGWVQKATYYILMLFVVLAVLQTLNLTIAAQPINAFLAEVFAFLPAILGAIALLLLAWLIATLVRFLVQRGLKLARVDERLTAQADVTAPDTASISDTLGNVLYWLIFLLFLPAVIGALGLEGLLVPVQSVVGEILSILPNLLGAALILILGWLGARIVRQIVVNLLSAIGIDRFGDRTGVSEALGEQTLSGIIGTVIYVLILLPVAIAALNTLNIPAVSEPAAAMLTTILNAFPAIFGALLLLALAYLAARVVGSFVTNVLTGLGFNNVLTWLGLDGQMQEEGSTPSEIVGLLATIAVMLFAVIEAANLLGFTILAGLVSEFLVAAWQVLLGIVIFGLGLYLAALARRVVRNTGGDQAHVLAPASYVAIVVFSGALALRQMGIAQDIVNLAFGLLLGAVAVAAALAFGLGARDAAGHQVERWLEQLGGTEATSQAPEQSDQNF